MPDFIEINEGDDGSGFPQSLVVDVLGDKQFRITMRYFAGSAEDRYQFVRWQSLSPTSAAKLTIELLRWLQEQQGINPELLSEAANELTLAVADGRLHK